MTRFIRVPAMLLATVSLSGCAVFGHVFADRSPARTAPAQSDVGNVELAAARQAMDAGLTAEAIDHFRAAQMDPQALPAASNGLGVAYARLGRYDLADRYFRMAMALDPTNPRFAANMLKLQGDYALAQAKNLQATELAAAQAPAETAAASVPAAIPAAASAPAVAMVERPGGLVRVSRGEVHIRTAPVQAGAPRVVVASRDAIPAVDTVAAKLGDAKPASNYPVRIDLSKRASSAGGESTTPQYPQRIDLSKVVLVD